ncbi:hypothetical protein PMG11_02357 [Penicillium brasilianum]|uniref:Transmembrane protein n=1 Tax=Penicillium brasilianum TaxID=104259 RepID=A0A0F7TL08_PENBI|nr:hypothetical protein PMG11_02357 [Penicillium brasilianum]
MIQKQSIGLYALSLFPLTRAMVYSTTSSTAAAHDSLRPDLAEATPWADAGLRGLHRRDGYNDSYTGTVISATGSAAVPATTTYTEWASASVCGFVDGVLDYSSEIACYGYTQCVFHTADVNYPAMVGCCDNAYSQKCLFETTCYDSAQVAATPSLTESPENGAIFCTKSTAASCIHWTYPELSITDFGCSNIHTTQTLYLTAHPYSNNVPISKSLSYYNGIPTVASVIGSVVNDNFISDYFNQAAATGSVNRNVPTSSGAASSGAASGSATGSSAASNSGSTTHHSNTAAIAGGVVGGVVGLAGIGAAIFMFCLMQKKKKNNQQPTYEPAPTGGSVVSSPPPPPPMSDLPSPSEVSGSSYHKYAAVDAYQAEQKFQSGPQPQEMDSRSFVAELPVPAPDSRPLSYGETPISYTSGHRY